MRVLIFGDSIAQGFWDHQGGWVERLRREYDGRQMRHPTVFTEPELYNLAISGDKSDKILRRLEPEIIARRWHDEPLAVVVAVGVNDSYVMDGQPYSSVDNYAQNLEGIIITARKQTERLLLVELTLCDEKLTTPVAWDPIEWTNARLTEFNSALGAVCQKHQVPLVKVFDIFMQKQQRVNLLKDGLHPNDAGHELIYNLVKPELEKILD